MPRPSSPLSTKASTRRPFQRFILSSLFITHAQKTNQNLHTAIAESLPPRRIPSRTSLKQISCLDQCRIHMNHKSTRTHAQTYWHTFDRSMLKPQLACKNIRAREPHKPSALKRAKRSSARVRPRCPRKSSSTMSMNVRPLQKTEVRDQGTKPSSLTSSFLSVYSLPIGPRRQSRQKQNQRSREAKPFLPKAKNGGADRDRTDDLKLAKLALSQLSYGPF